MASPKCVFYLTCLLVGKMAHATNLKFLTIKEESGFVSVKAGENVMLQCFYKGDMASKFYWYKQTLGLKPRMISTFYKYQTRADFHDEFNNSRFTLDTEYGNHHLRITDLEISDSATYYCASSLSCKLQFKRGILVSVKGSGLSVPALVQQAESIQPGGSVTLNCTVHTVTCDGEHSVYWFRDAEESHPGLIYTHGGSDDQCERKPNTQTHTCVYNLPLKSLNLSQAGTYYCAIVSCGHILFGDRTKLDFKDEDTPVLVYSLGGALAFTTTLSVLLGFLLWMMHKRSICRCAESQARFASPATTNEEGEQNEENIHYATVGKYVVDRSKTRNSNEAECIYSRIKK